MVYPVDAVLGSTGKPTTEVESLKMEQLCESVADAAFGLQSLFWHISELDKLTGIAIDATAYELVAQLQGHILLADGHLSEPEL